MLVRLQYLVRRRDARKRLSIVSRETSKLKHASSLNYAPSSHATSSRFSAIESVKKKSDAGQSLDNVINTSVELVAERSQYLNKGELATDDENAVAVDVRLDESSNGDACNKEKSTSKAPEFYIEIARQKETKRRSTRATRDAKYSRMRSSANRELSSKHSDDFMRSLRNIDTPALTVYTNNTANTEVQPAMRIRKKNKVYLLK